MEIPDYLMKSPNCHAKSPNCHAKSPELARETLCPVGWVWVMSRQGTQAGYGLCRLALPSENVFSLWGDGGRNRVKPVGGSLPLEEQSDTGRSSLRDSHVHHLVRAGVGDFKLNRMNG
ncbi:hypothetical protein Q31b_28130 [Novipirellula aureliae]|uniref:Uncharacterized protein n=1 Tax=Novipirellula aureliae TaxID=2527966 RepID=A0A5C6E2J1_9BACT|nr:hypothetical protein Q31b_28130 [Novipirellula aureliae]